MAVEFKLPELGENVEKGDVIRVLVNVGDLVAKDQPVVELETDKATIEVPSSVAGRVTEVRVKPGDKVKVEQTVLVLDESASAASASKPEPATGRPRLRRSPPLRRRLPAPRRNVRPRRDRPGLLSISAAAVPRPPLHPQQRLTARGTPRSSRPPRRFGGTPVSSASTSLR